MFIFKEKHTHKKTVIFIKWKYTQHIFKAIVQIFKQFEILGADLTYPDDVSWINYFFSRNSYIRLRQKYHKLLHNSQNCYLFPIWIEHQGPELHWSHTLKKWLFSRKCQRFNKKYIPWCFIHIVNNFWNKNPRTWQMHMHIAHPTVELNLNS